jgi:hypothetical protein
VGIDGYSKFEQLHGAERDARAFETWLLHRNGGNVPQKNVTTILSSNYPAPSRPARARPMGDDVRAELETLVDDYLEDPKTRRRRLYLYLAGHGFGPTIDESALLMANASRQMLHHLPGVRCGNYFREYPVFSEVVLLMDCCRDHHDRQPLVDLGLPLLKARRSEAPYFFAFATKWTLRTREGVDESGEVRGHFTRALIEGLDQPGATSESVVKYVASRLPELAPRREYYEPEFRCGKTISFGRRSRPNGEPPGVVNVIFANPDASIRLRIVDSEKRIVAEADMDSSPWSVPLPRGLYELSRSDRRERQGFTVPTTGSIDVQA